MLRPMAVAGNSDLGRGTKVYFRFVDERDDVVIGHRGVGGNGAAINTTDLPKVMETSLRDALSRRGYQLVDAEQASDASVTYRLRSMKFDISQGFFTGGEDVTAAMAVEAKRGNRTYDQVYRYNDEQRDVVVPTGNAIDDHVNTALTSILQQAYGDNNLDSTLIGK